MAIKTVKEYAVNVAVKEVLQCKTLNFTDIANNNNKAYQAELNELTDGTYALLTSYGRVGANYVKEYRLCSTLAEAQKEFDRIIKSKIKKGYVEVTLVKTDIGSAKAKEKIATDLVSIELLEKNKIKVPEPIKSTLHPKVQSLISSWFSSTAQFVESNLDTKRCPLGQLSLDQILKGKDILEQARLIIHSSQDIAELNRLTSLYYSNIPHVLPHRIDASALRLDIDTKIDHCFDIMDVLSDAKSLETTLSVRSNIDQQYSTLNAAIDALDTNDPTYQWIEKMFHETRAKNHSGLGKLSINNIYKLSRNNENQFFLDTAKEIAKCNCKFNPSKTYAKFVYERPDVPDELKELYNKANILPGWHGSRRANMIGITTKGLLIRPSGVVHCGSMYGDGIYWATNSTKAINYCDTVNSVWNKGSTNVGYLFLADIAFGNQKIATHSYMYTKNNIKPNHSTFAAANSNVINDELIVYNAAGVGQQHLMRYVIEFQTK